MERGTLYCRLNVLVMLVCLLCFVGMPAVEAGLVGHWRFNEGTGTTAADDSGEGNSGTLTNMDSGAWVEGESGYALSFDGVDDWVNCGTDTSLNPVNAITVTAWVKLDSSSGHSNTVVNRGYANDVGEIYWVTILDYYRYVRFYWGNGTTKDYLTTTTAIPVGEWHHVAATFNAGDARIYIDGVLAASKTSVVTTMQQQAWDTQIGKYWNVGHHFAGTMDEIRIYDNALSAAEIKTVYEGISGCWEMSEGTGTSVADSSGNGNNGTLINMDNSAWVDGHLDTDGYFRYALHFDGVNDNVYCGNNSNLSLASTFTLSMWLRPTGKFGEMNGFFNSYLDQNIRFYIDSGSHPAKVRWRKADGSYVYYTLVDSMPENEWTLITVVFDSFSDTLKGYKNGMLSVSNNAIGGVLNDSTTVKQIGWANNMGGYFCGDIDKVRLYDYALSADEIQATQLLSALPDRNYYTGENAVAISSLNITSEEGLTGCYLVAKDAQGNSLGTNSSPGINTDLTYATSSLPDGNNTITVELRKNSGERLFLTSFDILKRAANSGNEVKVDLRNNMVIRNGNPFFPIGLYLYKVPSNGTSVFDAVSTAGFNTIIRWQNSGCAPSDSTTYLENAALYDLLVVDTHQAYTSIPLSDYKWGTEEAFWNAYVSEKDNILDAVDYAKQESNLLGYYTFDEALATQIPSAQDLYDTINGFWDYGQSGAVDGYHPTFIVHMVNTMYEGEEYTAFGDIIAHDAYLRPPFRSVNWVTKYTCQAKQRALQDRKGFWMVLSSEYGGNRKRAILPVEQRCQSYLALIHGAKGIFYWQYPLYHQSSWDTFATSGLPNELSALAPSVLAPDLVHNINYYSNSVPAVFNPENDQFVDVQVSLRKNPGVQNGYILLAANTREYQVAASYSISLLGSSGTVSRMFSQDTYNVVNGVFSDTLTGFATRAYTFTSLSAEPVVISVNATPPSPLPTLETAYTDIGRPGKTNLMQNPSLEDNALPNWPDYCSPWADFSSYRIGTANQPWGLVADSPYHGSKCLKMVKQTADTAGFYCVLTPGIGNYTLSLYMKADQDGRRVKIGHSASSTYTVATLATSWSRYQCSFDFPSGVAADGYIKVILLDTGATFWADAVQMEAGTTATAFTVD